jgi:hypothetical protein
MVADQGSEQLWTPWPSPCTNRIHKTPNLQLQSPDSEGLSKFKWTQKVQQLVHVTFVGTHDDYLTLYIIRQRIFGGYKSWPVSTNAGSTGQRP